MAHGFVKARLAADQRRGALGLLPGRVFALHHLAGIQRGRDLVVAVHARDFLREVAHARDVRAEARHDDLAAFDCEAQLLEVSLLLRIGQGQAEQAVHFIRFKG